MVRVVLLFRAYVANTECCGIWLKQEAALPPRKAYNRVDAVAKLASVEQYPHTDSSTTLNSSKEGSPNVRRQRGSTSLFDRGVACDWPPLWDVRTAKPRLGRAWTPDVTRPYQCVQILSPEDSAIETLDKVREYVAFGVKWVWVIDPVSLAGRVYGVDSAVEADRVFSTPLFLVDLSQADC